MADEMTLRDAVKAHGSFAVWDLLDEDERRQAAVALWSNAESDTAVALTNELAKALKFRPKAVRALPAERVAGRLVRLVRDLPEAVVFQFLFHLHMQERRELLAEFLDAVGLPHDNGVLELDEESPTPSDETVTTAAKALLAQHGKPALVYLATLWLADRDLWSAIGSVLEAYSADGAETE